jgi:hypothetical protein
LSRPAHEASLRLPLVPDERGDVDLGLVRPMMHEHAFPADERWSAVGRTDHHPVAYGLELELAPRDQMKLIAKRFGDNQPAG